ncbi:unnamed protein product, partial [Ectocarpus sp. 8 AP-2014]
QPSPPNRPHHAYPTRIRRRVHDGGGHLLRTHRASSSHARGRSRSEHPVRRARRQGPRLSAGAVLLPWPSGNGPPPATARRQRGQVHAGRGDSAPDRHRRRSVLRV